VPHQKPTSITVIAIINIIIGGIGGIWALAGILAMTSNPILGSVGGSGAMLLLFYATNILSVCAFILAVISGVAVLTSRPWTLGILWAFVLTFVANIILSMTFGVMASNILYPSRTQAILLVSIIFAIIYLIYPIIIIFYIRSSKWNDFLSSKSSSPA